jgi:predicted membrane protein
VHYIIGALYYWCIILLVHYIIGALYYWCIILLVHYWCIIGALLRSATHLHVAHILYKINHRKSVKIYQKNL